MEIKRLLLISISILLISACTIKKKKAMNQKIDFQTSHNQFYICDKDSELNTGLNFWDSSAYSARLAVNDGVIGIYSESYGHIRGTLEVSSIMPIEADFQDYDHVVEGGFVVKSGVLQIINCPDSEVEMRINLPIGNYRARVYIAGLTGNSSDSFEEKRNDFYKIVIWPDKNISRIVIKQYH